MSIPAIPADYFDAFIAEQLAKQQDRPPMSTEADIVERWMGMFDPPPQLDVQQLELLKGTIRAERDAAARDMRERCAKVADTYKDDSRYTGDISLIGATIRALPDTPAMVATSGKDAT